METAAKTLFEIAPKEANPYVVLSQYYRSTGKVEESNDLIKKRLQKEVYKIPGQAWVTINGKVRR